MSTMEEINEALDLVGLCMHLAAKTGNACFEDQTDLRGLAGNFIARGAQSLYSAGLLAQHGLIGDALSCGRTVVEMAIDFAYIALDPAARIARFSAYGDVHEFRLARGVNNHGGNLRAEFLAELEARHLHFRANNPGSAANWAGRDLFQRATEADRLAHYEMAYAEMCNASHSGPGTLEYAQVDVDGTRRVRFGRMTQDTHPILVAFSAMLILISDIVTKCRLDRTLGERCDALADRMKTLRQFSAG